MNEVKPASNRVQTGSSKRFDPQERDRLLELLYFRGGSAPPEPPGQTLRAGGSLLVLMGPLGSQIGPLHPYIMVSGDFQIKLVRISLFQIFLTIFKDGGTITNINYDNPKQFSIFLKKKCLSDSGSKPSLVIGRF